MSYAPASDRYTQLPIHRVGHSGLQLPRISLGLWHNFGAVDDAQGARELVLAAFDRGIFHFDLANNYGPPPGAAEQTLGKLLSSDLGAYRDELIVSTKAGYPMWPGPFGDFGSRKSLLASLDQSLRRLGLDYVDIFYHHRPDPETPLEETMAALDHAVRVGKALYVGISNYGPELTARACRLLRAQGTPFVVHQLNYSLLERGPEQELLPLLAREELGCVAFSPLAQGRLTDRYLSGIPQDSRAAKAHGFLQPEQITGELLGRLQALQRLAQARGQTVAQLALTWVLRSPVISSAILGVSRLAQLEESLACLQGAALSAEELAEIDQLFPAG